MRRTPFERPGERIDGTNPIAKAQQRLRLRYVDHAVLAGGAAERQKMRRGPVELRRQRNHAHRAAHLCEREFGPAAERILPLVGDVEGLALRRIAFKRREHAPGGIFRAAARDDAQQMEEHTSELQSLMRISYAVFCLKKKKKHNYTIH